MNTLKFGNGEWYGKKDTILAYNDENSNFKPLPFSFDRASSATVVNKDGLIETVGSGEPRIDYKDDSKGALLLEPTRTNKYLYSQDFSNAYWTKSGTSVISGFTSPDGTLNAFKLVGDGANSTHLLRVYTSETALTNYSFSFFVKKGEITKLGIREDAQTGGYISFDLTTKTIISSVSMTLTYEEVGDYLRLKVVSQIGSNATSGYTIYMLDDTYSSGIVNGSRVIPNGSGFYIYGAQLEQGSYATSIIPTQGGAVTRNQDVCSQTPPSGVIGQTEGTMYAEIDFKSKSEVGSPIVGIMTLNNNVNNLQNCIVLGIERQSEGINRFYPYVQVGNSTVAYVIGETLTDGNYKVAFAYKQNDFVLYVNGVQIGTDTNGAVPTTSQALVGERYNSDTYKIADGIKETKLYNTRLSNSELQALTTI